MRLNGVSLFTDIQKLIFPQLIEAITSNGRIHLAGGALRDYYMFGKFLYPELDFIVSGLKKNELLAILRKFGKARYVGKSFRVIKFYREDTPQNSHDFSLPVLHQEITDSLLESNEGISVEEDLASRDFTINSMAFDLGKKEFLDLFGGVKDIEQKVIRTIREDAFERDPIRVIRAIRFATQFGFEIDPNTWYGLSNNSDSVNNMAVERVRDELVKILLRCKNPSGAFLKMEDVGLLKNILPELHQCSGVSQPGGRHDHDVFIHSLKSVDYAPQNLVVRLAALFHDVGKPPKRFVPKDGRARFYGHQELSDEIAKRRLKQLKFPNKTIKKVSTLISNHMFTHKVTQKGVRRLIKKVSEDLVPDLFQLRYADMKAQNPRLSLAEDREFEERVNDEINRKPPITVSDLAIDGNDIMESFGLKPGKLIGKIQDHLIEKVIEDPEINEKEKLLDIVKIFLDYLDKNN
ncbi:HD domain-containing protein [bacterium]|nr:HD domain-containing protein [bacterium]